MSGPPAPTGQLHPGDPAPDFALTNDQGQTVCLSGICARWRLLIFLRHRH